MSEKRKLQNTSNRGFISELCILTEFARLGEKILESRREDLPYDLVLDNTDGTVERIQVKTGRIKNGSIVFSTCWRKYISNRNKQSRVSYEGYADWFAVWCPDLREAFLIHVSDCGPTETSLRVDHPKNNQKKGVKFCVDYRLADVVKMIRRKKPLRY